MHNVNCVHMSVLYIIIVYDFIANMSFCYVMFIMRGVRGMYRIAVFCEGLFLTNGFVPSDFSPVVRDW